MVRAARGADSPLGSTGGSSWRSASWPAPQSEVGWGIGAAVGCFLGAQLLAFLWAVLVVGLRYGGDGLPPVAERPFWLLPLLNVALWIGYLAGPVVVARLSERTSIADFDLRVSPLQATGAAIAGIAAQLAVLPALYWVLLRFVSGDPSQVAEDLVDRIDGGVDVVLLVISVVVMAPLAEEWFYRGMVLPALGRRFGTVVGAVGSAGIFTIVHQEPILFPGLFLLGLLLAWIVISTGRIGPAIVAHAAFNATTVVQLLVLA